MDTKATLRPSLDHLDLHDPFTFFPFFPFSLPSLHASDPLSTQSSHLRAQAVHTAMQAQSGWTPLLLITNIADAFINPSWSSG